jgi:hypothetical protein
MNDLIDNIKKEENIKEASYSGNIGFQEMVEFYKKASPMDIKQMEKFIKNNSWIGIKKLFKKILGVNLKG